MFQIWHLPLEACCTMPRCNMCKYLHHFLFCSSLHKLMFAFMIGFILFQVYFAWYKTKCGWHFIELFARDISPHSSHTLSWGNISVINGERPKFCHSGSPFTNCLWWLARNPPRLSAMVLTAFGDIEPEVNVFCFGVFFVYHHWYGHTSKSFHLHMVQLFFIFLTN